MEPALSLLLGPLAQGATGATCHDRRVVGRFWSLQYPREMLSVNSSGSTGRRRPAPAAPPPSDACPGRAALLPGASATVRHTHTATSTLVTSMAALSDRDSH